MYQIWYLLVGKHGEDRIYLRTWVNMVFTTFASDLLSCLLHLYSLVNLSKSIFSSSVCKFCTLPRLFLLIHLCCHCHGRRSLSSIKQPRLLIIYSVAIVADPHLPTSLVSWRMPSIAFHSLPSRSCSMISMPSVVLEDSFFVFFLVGLHLFFPNAFFLPWNFSNAFFLPWSFSNASIVVDVVLDNDMHWILPFFFLHLCTVGTIDLTFMLSWLDLAVTTDFSEYHCYTYTPTFLCPRPIECALPSIHLRHLSPFFTRPIHLLHLFHFISSAFGILSRFFGQSYDIISYDWPEKYTFYLNRCLSKWIQVMWRNMWPKETLPFRTRKL